MTEPVLSNRVVPTVFQTTPLDEVFRSSWIWNHGVAPFLEAYLHKAGGCRLDKAVFERVLERVAACLAVPQNVQRWTCPLGNARLAGDPVELDQGLRIRPVIAEELEYWLNPPWLGGAQPWGCWRR
jgi:hypothetical protein